MSERFTVSVPVQPLFHAHATVSGTFVPYCEFCEVGGRLNNKFNKALKEFK